MDLLVDEAALARDLGLLRREDTQDRHDSALTDGNESGSGIGMS